jgi:hypothetical protein
MNRQQRRAEERKAAKGGQSAGILPTSIDHFWPGGELKAKRLAASGDVRRTRALAGWKNVFDEFAKEGHQTCSECMTRIVTTDDIAAVSVFQTHLPVIDGKPLIVGMPFCKRCLPAYDVAKLGVLARSALHKVPGMEDTAFIRRQNFVPVKGMPVPMDAVTVEDFLASGEVTDSQTLGNFVIGSRGRLTQDDAAESAKQLARLFAELSPTTPVYLCIQGYDHDPRELHEIPETRTFLGWFATEFDKAGLDPSRVLQQSREILEFGRHVAAGHDIEVTVRGDTATRFLDDIADFQDAAMSKLS